MYVGRCGPPEAADGVVIHPYTTTFEGSSITFTCEDGIFSNVNITATCTGEGHWSTDPATYMCIDTGKILSIFTIIYNNNCSYQDIIILREVSSDDEQHISVE